MKNCKQFYSSTESSNKTNVYEYMSMNGEEEEYKNDADGNDIDTKINQSYSITSHSKPQAYEEYVPVYH